MKPLKTEQSLERLHAAIHAKKDSLTPTEKKIAAYLLEHTRDVVFMSVQELAAHLQTGPASIIRVVQKIGYGGLSELKRELKKNIREDVSPLVRFKSTLDSQVESGLAEIHMIAQQEVHNIEATLALLDQKSLAAAALALSKAHAIYTVGVGISSHAAGIAALVFQHIGLKASALQHTGLNISEQLIALRKGELLLAFSLPPYSTQTIDAAILAKKRHASVIGITNRTIAPISEHCDIVLVAKTESGVPSNSLTAPLVLIYGLTSIIAAQSRPRSLDALETTIKLRKQNLDSR